MSKAGLLVVAVLVAAPAWADEVFISVAEAQTLAAQKDGVRFVFADGPKEFADAHIPGSVEAYAHDLQLLDDVRACKGLPMCEPRAAELIGKLGIDANTRVVVYDNGMGPNASGAWFFLKLYGHPDVRILDGGLATWKAKGLPTEKGHPAVAAKPPFKTSVQWDLIATREDVQKAIADPAHYLLLDARHNLDEYTGKQLLTGLSAPGKESTVARGGFIPTAVFSPWTKYAGNKKGEPDKPTLKDADDLQKQLQKLKKSGYAPEKTVISYCHVGLGRGSFQYLALQKAGHAKTKVYVGSWSEWGNTPSLPLGTIAAAPVGGE